MVGGQAVAQPHRQIECLVVVHGFEGSFHAHQYTITDGEGLFLSDKLLGGYFHVSIIYNGRSPMGKQARHHRGEGSVYYDKKNDRWAASFFTEDGKRRYVYGKTEREAWEKLRAAQYEEKQGLLARGPKQTLKDYLNYWLEDAHKATLKVSTYVMYRRHLDNHIIPHLGHIQLK